jgi:twitching motility two-component system response regulator PilH
MNTLLIVEDSQAQREIIRELLKEIGLKIIFALDGIEALELVEKECPALVVLDIVMPRMNGYEVCRRLKGNDKTKKLAVVMYSTKTFECDFYWGKKVGADAYVSKLAPPKVLLKTIEQILQKAVTHQEACRIKTINQYAELINQIKLVDSNLRTYKKAQSNPPDWMDTKNLASYIKQIEAELDELESQLKTLSYILSNFPDGKLTISISTQSNTISV